MMIVWIAAALVASLVALIVALVVSRTVAPPPPPPPTRPAECRPDPALTEATDGTPDELATIAGLQSDMNQFLELLRSVDPKTYEITAARYTGRVILVRTGTGGRFSTRARCIGMELTGTRGRGDLTQARLRSKLLHELAHASTLGAGDAHGAAWRDTFLHFLELASTMLGWDLDLDCTGASTSACRYGVCAQLAQGRCPQCDFDQQIDSCTYTAT